MDADDTHATFLSILGQHLRHDLEPRTYVLANGIRVGVDGAAAGEDGLPSVLVQASPARGPVKSAQRNKLVADAFKLDWLRSNYFPESRAILAVNPPLARLLTPGAWLPAALADRRIEVAIIDGVAVRTLDEKALRVGNETGQPM